MIRTRLEKARAAIIVDHPFFATLLLTMPMIESEEIPTMATDGETILYNPKWSDSLSLNEIIFVLAHETMHCVFDHMGRRAHRTPNRWNQAADYIINEILISDGVGSMPKNGLYDPKLTKKGGNTAEGVYKLIPEENEGKSAGQQGGALDHVHDTGTNNGTEPTDQAKMKEKGAALKVRVLTAKNVAKMQGKLSAGLERLVDDLVQPKVDWRHVLRKFVSERAKVDFSFARPKRRFLYDELYLPSLTGERMGKLVVAVDCSGSVTPQLLVEFASEINAIKEDLKPSGLDVVYFDSKVCRVDTFTQDEDLVIKPAGGGGTAFSPVIEHVNKMSDQPSCVVFLTDLYCDDWGLPPAYPVLWCVIAGNPHQKVPYGEILEVSSNED